MIYEAVSKLASYALRTGLIEESEYIWAVNVILDTLKIDSYTDPRKDWGEIFLSYHCFYLSAAYYFSVNKRLCLSFCETAPIAC